MRTKLDTHVFIKQNERHVLFSNITFYGYTIQFQQNRWYNLLYLTFIKVKWK